MIDLTAIAREAVRLDGLREKPLHMIRAGERLIERCFFTEEDAFRQHAAANYRALAEAYLRLREAAEPVAMGTTLNMRHLKAALADGKE